jgi:hypothetical protein
LFTIDPMSDADIVVGNEYYTPLGDLPFAAETMLEVTGNLVPVPQTGLQAIGFEGLANFVTYADANHSIIIGTLSGTNDASAGRLMELKEWATTVSLENAEWRNIGGTGDLEVALLPIIIVALIGAAVTLTVAAGAGFRWLITRRDLIHACNALSISIFRNCNRRCVQSCPHITCLACCNDDYDDNKRGCASPAYQPVNNVNTCVYCP